MDSEAPKVRENDVFSISLLACGICYGSSKGQIHKVIEQEEEGKLHTKWPFLGKLSTPSFENGVLKLRKKIKLLKSEMSYIHLIRLFGGLESNMWFPGIPGEQFG